MDDYIKREEAIDAVLNVYFNTPKINLIGKLFYNAILELQPADVAQVKHGWWGSNGVPDSMLNACSVCGFGCGAYSFRYCPNCGAKMDGDDK